MENSNFFSNLSNIIEKYKIIYSVIIFFLGYISTNLLNYVFSNTDLNKAVYSSINGNQLDSSIYNKISKISDMYICNKNEKGQEIIVASNPNLQGNVCNFIISDKSKINIDDLDGKQIVLSNNSVGNFSCVFKPSIILHCTNSVPSKNSTANITIGKEACKHLGLDTNFNSIIKLSYKIASN